MHYPYKHKPHVVFSKNAKLNSLQETMILPVLQTLHNWYMCLSSIYFRLQCKKYDNQYKKVVVQHIQIFRIHTNFERTI